MINFPYYNVLNLKIACKCNPGGFDWNLFSEEYRDHPYFTIDDACLQEMTGPSSTDETVVPMEDAPSLRWH